MPSITNHLRLLADETRLRILHLLTAEPLTVAELQDLLDLSQSSVSGHLGKLKRSGFLHDHAEGSSHRYRIRDDLDADCSRSWRSVEELTQQDPVITADRQRLETLRAQRGRSWVERVAGSLHREYAPGRTWDVLLHGFACCLELGRCVDVGAGDGALIELLAPRCQELICVDPTAAMLDAARDRISGRGLNHVRFEQASGEQLPLEDASVDTVLFVQSLQYIPEPARALQEAIRILRPGGRLVVMTLQAHGFSESLRYGHVHRGFAADDLRAWLTGLDPLEVHPLPPESRPPRFAPLVIAGVKPT
ncbi:MAG: metalloregulator ArsR/SmtB family transcription factor [Planctomycetota bacterium]|jgi:SAM-dependent methyltransferase|nr:metalloregulator ArsR/SmtB family transcription factor [Planctomycetota bacterium]